MDLKLTSVRICVDDVQACYAFYRDVLGLKPKFDATDSVYAEFDAGDGASLGVYEHKRMQEAVGKRHDDTVKSPAERVVLTFFVTSVDETITALRQRGVKIEREPQDRPDWMLRVAHFRDPAGNLLEVHQPLAGRTV